MEPVEFYYEIKISIANFSMHIIQIVSNIYGLSKWFRVLLYVILRYQKPFFKQHYSGMKFVRIEGFVRPFLMKIEQERWLLYFQYCYGF